MAAAVGRLRNFTRPREAARKLPLAELANRPGADVRNERQNGAKAAEICEGLRTATIVLASSPHALKTRDATPEVEAPRSS